MAPRIIVHQKDLPSADFFKTKSLAVDTETMGLLPHRDRLCVVQVKEEDSDTVHLIQIEIHQKKAPNLEYYLTNSNVLKIFHYARFDIAVLRHTFGINVSNIYCTKIASKLCRTYTNKHGLKDLCSELLNIELSKEQQSSDWGDAALSAQQQLYAASDVLHLHDIQKILHEKLIRENRLHIAQACFDFLSIRSELDLLAGEDFDIFSHKG